MKIRFRHLFSGILLCATVLSIQTAKADTVSFLVDPDTIDTNMDGFITGSEFQPVGSGGTIFDLTPTNNLVGADRFLLSDDKGIHYGGGGGSTLSFDFTVNEDIALESYTLASSGFFLGNPSFSLLEGVTVISSTNTSNSSGDTHNFNGGPILLDSGSTYTFETQVFGAGVQAYMDSWTYSVTAVPEPGCLGLILLSGIALSTRRRR